MINLDFTQDLIKMAASGMDANQFDSFIKANRLEAEYLDKNKKDKNKGLYEAYLFDFDLTIHYVDGKFMNV